MKTNMTKRAVAGGFAVLMSMGLVLPTYAASSSAGDKTNVAPKATVLSAKDTATLNSMNFQNIDLNQIIAQLQGAGGLSLTNPTSGGQAVPAAPAAPSESNSSLTSGSGSSNPTPAAPKPDAQGTVGSGNSGQQQAASDASQYAKEVIKLVNQERAKQNLKPLTEDTALSNMALVKAKDMSQNHYFDHTSPTYGSPFDMMNKFNISYSYAGENIAEGQKTPQEVMTAWMNSEGHRANILNSNYTTIGVAYYNGYWVQEFVGK
jgi:uncharacterized YkwD family protein